MYLLSKTDTGDHLTSQYMRIYTKQIPHTGDTESLNQDWYNFGEVASFFSFFYIYFFAERLPDLFFLRKGLKIFFFLFFFFFFILFVERLRDFCNTGIFLLFSSNNLKAYSNSQSNQKHCKPQKLPVRQSHTETDRHTDGHHNL